MTKNMTSSHSSIEQQRQPSGGSWLENEFRDLRDRLLNPNAEITTEMLRRYASLRQTLSKK